MVKELRDKSGAGMMQCKKALAEAGGDVDKAVELLRVKGLATADKKAGRAATEGIVTSYIHAGARWVTNQCLGHYTLLRPLWVVLQQELLSISC